MNIQKTPQTQRIPLLGIDPSRQLKGEAPSGIQPQDRFHASGENDPSFLKMDQLRALALGSRSSTQMVSTGSPSQSTVDKALKTIRSHLSTGPFDWAVTNHNAKTVHNELAGTDAQEFNDVVQAMCKEDDGHMINTYLKELQQADPKKVQEFTKWLSQCMDQQTAKQIMRATDTESWSLLMESSPGLEPEEMDSLLNRFGPDKLNAKNWYEKMRAEHSGYQKPLNRIMGFYDHLSTASDLRPTVMRTLRSKFNPTTVMLGQYAKALTQTPAAFVRGVNRAITSTTLKPADVFFLTQLERGGTSGEKALKVLDVLRDIYVDDPYSRRR